VVRRIAEKLGIHLEALRAQVGQAEIDWGDRPGATTDKARRIKELEKVRIRVPSRGVIPTTSWASLLI
jgi:putative transposase orfA for insertion sequence element